MHFSKMCIRDRYDTGNFYLLVKTREEEFGSQTLDLKKPAKLRLIKSNHFDVEDVIPAISIPEEGPVYLRVTTTQEGLYAKFFYSLDGKDYQELAEVLSLIHIFFMIFLLD